MYAAQDKFASDYLGLRTAVIKGDVTVEQAKTWIRRRGVITALQAEDQVQARMEKQGRYRADRDIPELGEDDE